MSLLSFIPGIGQLICMMILAFGRWPIEDQLAALRRGGCSWPDAAAGPPPPPGTGDAEA